MNWIRRTVVEIARRNSSLLLPSSLSTQAKALATNWPRPSEIPYQVKVANSISITGYVDMPIQFKSSSDGKVWAATIINQIVSKHSPPLWIPVIFEGDLAHVAASHLKPNDRVHIAGELFADSPTHQGNVNVQVMVHSVNFIEEYYRTKKASSDYQEQVSIHNSVSKRNDHSSSWSDLLDNPNDWLDFRSKKLDGTVKPKHPDFKRRDGTVSLWLTGASNEILNKIKAKEFHANKSKHPKKSKDEELWKNMVENPSKWWDNRLNKLTEKSPDFRHKETGQVLWLSDSPDWVLSKLPEPKSKQNPVNEKSDTFTT